MHTRDHTRCPFVHFVIQKTQYKFNKVTEPKLMVVGFLRLKFSRTTTSSKSHPLHSGLRLHVDVVDT